MNYEYIHQQSDFEKVVSWLSDKKVFVLDTETGGLNPFTSDIILLQVGNDEKQWIVDCRTVNIDQLKPFLEDEKITKIGQNLKHDLKFLMWRKGWLKFKNLFDTMINEQVIRCGFHAGASMEALVLRYLNIQIDKTEGLRKSFWNTAVNAFSKEQLDYAAGDVYYPLLIAKLQKQLIIERGLTATILLEHKVIPVLASMELKGMAIDQPAWNKLYEEALVGKQKAEQQLNTFFKSTSFVQEDVFGEDKTVREVDYDSPHQMKKALAKLGYVLDNTLKTTIALAAINGHMPKELAQSILLYRKYFTRKTRYGTEFLNALEPTTNRIHTDFTQCLTTNGRLSSKEDEDSETDKVNLQNIPRDSEYRECFVPREGYLYIVYDYQAIEPRILGELSYDPTYLRVFDNDLDLYGEIGTGILKKEVSKKTKELRNQTKITVLGNSYGTGKEKFYKKMLIDMNLENGLLKDPFILITKEDSDMMWEKFFEVCPKVKPTLDKFSDLADPVKSKRKIYDELAAYEEPQAVAAKIAKNLEKFSYKFKNQQDIIRDLVNSRGHVTYSQSIGGRKRYFKVHHRTFWTEGRNHPISATAADILKTAMVAVHDAIAAHKNDAFLVNQVHDELIIEVKAEQAEEVNSYIKPILEQSESKFLKRVAPKVEGGIFDRWQKG